MPTTPPRPLQLAALRTLILALELAQVEIAMAQSGKRPDGLDELLEGVRQTRGDLGMLVATEQARRRFASR